ncbi:MAG: amidohydrolase [Bacteroidales bacterium]|nr:amidohydrolase [Bacteroidales bacterium]
MKKGVFGLLAALLITSCQMKESVDLIIYNGNIYTVDSLFSTSNAVAVNDGVIVSVGSDNEILNQYRSVRMLDLEGKAMYPGFNDAHCHITGLGAGLLRVDLRGSSSFEEIIGRLEKSQKDSPSDYILGDGWDQNLWPEKSFPDNSKLNELFPNTPVILSRIDFHAVIVNEAAIKRLGLKPGDSSILPGEAILKDGQFSGVFLENTADRFKEILPEPDGKEMRRMLLAAEAECFKYGLTSISSAGADLALVEVLDSMQIEGEMQLRIDLWLTPGKEMFEKINKPYSKGRLRVGTIKMFADGALGSRGALMLKPYSDQASTLGIQATPSSVLDSNARWAFENGFQVAIHCIGDAANRLALNLYSKYLPEGNDLRWRIEHAQIIHPEDMELFGKYNIVPSIQPTHATSDMLWAVDRVGERIKGAYAYKELLNQNGWLPSGTDFPIEQVNPILTYFAAVQRVNLDFVPQEGFQMENSLTPEEALRSMTIWAAKASFEERSKGSIEKGKYADFTILDKDILTANREDIPSIKVLKTFVAGKEVYSAE